MATVQPACLADLNDDLLRKIASQLAESELASAVALKRCSSRFKDLAAPLVANAVSVTNEKWRDAAAKIGGRVGAKITGALERNEVPSSLDVRGNRIGRTGATAIADALKGTAVLTKLNLDGHELDLPKLRGTDPVTSLDLSRKSLGSASAIVIASLIAGNGCWPTRPLPQRHLRRGCRGAGLRSARQ